MRFKVVPFIVFFFTSLSLFANTAFTKRKDVQMFVDDLINQHHFERKQLNEIMNQVTILPEIIESMEKPYEKKNWDVYSAIFLTSKRLQEGLKFWEENQFLLKKAEIQYGVSAETIVAILGVETYYGTQQGEYKVLDALATLSFNYPKRAAFFINELKEYLLLCREQKLPVTYYLGSYAGAIGQPQFMPSSYRRYAIDFNHRGKIDLVADNAAAIGSVANYLHHFGWAFNEEIAEPVSIRGDAYKTLQVNPKYANYTYTQLKAAGVHPITTITKHPQKAAIIELDKNQGNEYWIVYPNFFVITHYNSSPQYALVVYLLSQQLKQQWAKIHSQKPIASL